MGTWRVKIIPEQKIFLKILEVKYADVLLEVIQMYVKQGSIIISDGYKSYQKYSSLGMLINM